MKPIINYQDFDKLDLRIGKVIQVERKEGSEKLLRLTVDFGEEGQRNILSGIYPHYEPDSLINKSFVFIINLEPRKIMGEDSQGMILCADGEKPIPLKPIKKVEAGTTIR